MLYKYLLLSTLFVFSPTTHPMQASIIKGIEWMIDYYNGNQNQPEWIKKAKAERIALENTLKQKSNMLFIRLNASSVDFNTSSVNNAAYLSDEMRDDFIQEFHLNPISFLKFMYENKKAEILISDLHTTIILDKRKEQPNIDPTLNAQTTLLKKVCGYELDGYSALGAAIVANQTPSVKRKFIEFLITMDVKSTKKDQMLAKLDFYEKTPELPTRNVLLCALLGYDFKKEKINPDLEPNPILSVDIIRRIISHLPIQELPLIAYNSY